MSFTDNGPEFDASEGKKDGAYPRFYMETRPNPAKSEKEGRPIFDDVEMVEIMVPGDRLNIVHRLVRDDERKRWPGAYRAFKADQDAPLNGTPLDQLPGMTKGRVEELKYFHVRTIEQLAGMPDDLLMKAAPMDGRALRDKALRWVDNTAGAEKEERLAAENRAKDEKISIMERDLAQMRDTMAAMQAQMTAQQASGAQASVPPSMPAPVAQPAPEA
jgi:hypothetical protein